MHEDLLFIDWGMIGCYDTSLYSDTDIDISIRHSLDVARLPNLEGYVYNRNKNVGYDKINKPSSMFAIPSPSSQDLDFDQCLDYVVDQLLTKHATAKKFLAWSGGVDSTSLVCSLFKNASREQLNTVTIICSQESIDENPYFFYHFIQPNVASIDINNFKIDKNFLSDSVIIDGETGNQINLGYWTADLASRNKWDLLDSHYKDIKLHDIIGIDPDTPGLARCRDILIDSAESAPLDINTVYDFTWWSNFNLKFDYVMYRKAAHSYTKHLDQSDTKIFFERCMIRPYAHELMQQWSMSSLPKRRLLDKTKTVKYFQKNYIYSIDKNPFYYHHKPEVTSMTKYFMKVSTLSGSMGSNKGTMCMSDVFAVTKSYRKLSFLNKEDRQILKTWLFD